LTREAAAPKTHLSRRPRRPRVQTPNPKTPMKKAAPKAVKAAVKMAPKMAAAKGTKKK